AWQERSILSHRGASIPVIACCRRSGYKGPVLRLSVADFGWPLAAPTLARKAESLGYRRYWIGEHHTRYQTGNPLLLMGLVAACTSAVTALGGRRWCVFCSSSLCLRLAPSWLSSLPSSFFFIGTLLLRLLCLFCFCFLFFLLVLFLALAPNLRRSFLTPGRGR